MTPLDLVAGMSVADLAAACRVDVGQCPACGATHRGARDRRPAVRLVGATGWRCWACEAKGGSLRWLAAWAGGRPLAEAAAEVVGDRPRPRLWPRRAAEPVVGPWQAWAAWADVEAEATAWTDVGLDVRTALQVVLALRAHALGWDGWDAAGEYVAGLDLGARMG